MQKVKLFKPAWGQYPYCYTYNGVQTPQCTALRAQVAAINADLAVTKNDYDHIKSEFATTSDGDFPVEAQEWQQEPVRTSVGNILLATKRSLGIHACSRRGGRQSITR